MQVFYCLAGTKNELVLRQLDQIERIKLSVKWMNDDLMVLVKDLPKRAGKKLIYQLEITWSERKLGKDLYVLFDAPMNSTIQK